MLLALAWPNHQFHAAASNRMFGSAEEWATCALTQLGFIRISSNPGFSPFAATPVGARALMARMVQDPLHVYLESLLPPAAIEPEFWARVPNHQHVTDFYLLRLAASSGAKLLTFDRRLAKVAGPDAVEIMSI